MSDKGDKVVAFPDQVKRPSPSVEEKAKAPNLDRCVILGVSGVPSEAAERFRFDLEVNLGVKPVDQDAELKLLIAIGAYVYDMRELVEKGGGVLDKIAAASAKK